MSLGTQQGTAVRDFNGGIDEFGLWVDRPLTGAEIAAIAGLGQFNAAGLDNAGIDAVLAVYAAASGSTTVGSDTYGYTTTFAAPADGSTRRGQALPRRDGEQVHHPRRDGRQLQRRDDGRARAGHPRRDRGGPRRPRTTSSAALIRIRRRHARAGDRPLENARFPDRPRRVVGDRHAAVARGTAAGQRRAVARHAERRRGDARAARRVHERATWGRPRLGRRAAGFVRDRQQRREEVGVSLSLPARRRRRPTDLRAARVDHAPLPGTGGLPDGTIYTAGDGAIYGLFIDGKSIVRLRFDPKANAFAEAGKLAFGGLPSGVGSVAILGTGDAGIELALSSQSGGKAPDGDRETDDYSNFNGAGIYRGVWPYEGVYRARVAADFSKVIEAAKLWSASPREVRGAMTIAGAVDVAGHRGLIATGRYGNAYFFPIDGDALAARQMVTNPRGVVLRHPSTGANAIEYPSRDGTTRDLIAGGEGALYYYPATGNADARGVPTFDAPTPVWQQDADVYCGSLAIPTFVDWDGDGAGDLIVGNSQGQVLFFKNFGTDAAPSFGLGERVKSGGRDIEIQQGYWSVQNITEARWGYTCPTVFDWNGDGLPDLLVGSAVQEHFVYLNVGTRTQPKLDVPIVLQDEGVNLVGQWRTRPGVVRMGGRIAYVMEDVDNQLARYWRVDDANVMSDGPLRLTTGARITIAANARLDGAGQTGRPTIELADWDGDGTLDCFIGTAKRGAIPEPKYGLPWYRRNQKGPAGLNLQLVYMRNAGSDAQPAFEYPQQLTFRGKDFYLGAHVNSPVVCKMGEVEGGRPNLLIGIESGRIMFYQHKDIGFAPRPATRPTAASVQSSPTAE